MKTCRVIFYEYLSLRNTYQIVSSMNMSTFILRTKDLYYVKVYFFGAMPISGFIWFQYPLKRLISLATRFYILCVRIQALYLRFLVTAICRFIYELARIMPNTYGTVLDLDLIQGKMHMKAIKMHSG